MTLTQGHKWFWLDTEVLNAFRSCILQGNTNKNTVGHGQNTIKQCLKYGYSKTRL